MAIDSPPSWGLGKGSRRTEQELGFRHPVLRHARRRGTRRSPVLRLDEGRVPGVRGSGQGRVPALRQRDRPRPGHRGVPPCQRGGALGVCPSKSVRKREFRTRVLRSQHVETDGLRSMDQVDAALAALTGLLALRGRHSALGDPKEGVIVLPVSSLPAHPYRRCPEPKAPDDIQVRFPGMTPCGCGDPSCREMTSREFAPGHDARRKSMLWATAREGQTAVDELRRRRWELPRRCDDPRPRGSEARRREQAGPGISITRPGPGASRRGRSTPGRTPSRRSAR